ncbi:MFS transporter [Alicyclobacillus fodiniaquatilis]|uniref:MFS transporter n=1 Tax=Alicyclobacillus fodiniaquatilis TaxID=1661150 RepID=A0ABW4JP18_9BACL
MSKSWGMRLLLRNRNYRFLWLAAVGSQFGNWFNEVAVAQVTLTLTHSPAAMGFVLLCRSLPSVVLGPLAGPFIDRLPKKPLLFLTDVIRAVLALTLSLSSLLHAAWILYISSILLGMAGALFSPVHSAVIPLVVSEAQLTTANTLESQTGGFMQMVGAACGGMVATTVGPVGCFVINALSYLWSGWYIARSHWAELPGNGQDAKRYIQSLRTGFQEVLHNRVARAIIVIAISWGVVGGGYDIVIPLLGQQVYHMGGLGIGLLYVVDGVGVTLGALAVQIFVGNNNGRAVIWYGVAYLLQTLFFVALTQFTHFTWGACMLLLMRMSSGIIIPLDIYLLQINTQPEIRGRVFSLYYSTYGGVMQLSYSMMGLAFATFGIPVVGMAIGAMSMLCGVFWLAQFGRKRKAVKGI